MPDRFGAMSESTTSTGRPPSAASSRASTASSRKSPWMKSTPSIGSNSQHVERDDRCRSARRRAAPPVPASFGANCAARTGSRRPAPRRGRRPAGPGRAGAGLVDLLQLVGGAGAIALVLRQLDVRIVDVVVQPGLVDLLALGLASSSARRIIGGMPALQLTPAERKQKRAEAHHLDPVVMIGDDGPDRPAVREGDRRRARGARPDQGARLRRRPRSARSAARRRSPTSSAPRRSSTSASCWCCGARRRRRRRPSAKTACPGRRSSRCSSSRRAATIGRRSRRSRCSATCGSPPGGN